MTYFIQDYAAIAKDIKMHSYQHISDQHYRSFLGINDDSSHVQGSCLIEAVVERVIKDVFINNRSCSILVNLFT